MDGPSNSKIVRLGDVNTVIENRGEEADGLPWDTDELARADLNNDGQIDINDITTVISQYTPAEGNVEFSNDLLNVSDETVDINVSDLNNTVNENVDVVIVNNNNSETKDITESNISISPSDGNPQSINIDTENVDPRDELEVQIHEVNDPDPEDAGGSPIDTATANVAINPTFNSAEVTNTSNDNLRVTFDANVSANESTGFSVDTDNATALTVQSFSNVANNDTVVLNLNRSVTDGEEITTSYNGNGDVTSSVDESDAQSFTDKLVDNNVS